MKVGDFFFEHGSYYVIKKMDEAAQYIYYTVYYFYAMHPDKSLHIDNSRMTFGEYEKKFSGEKLNDFNKIRARVMLYKIFKE